MNIKQIHHVAIIASDYQVSKHFYTEILGLPVIRETYRKERDSYMLDLQLGNIQIELFSFPNPPQRPTSPEATGLRHLCFQVEDFDAAIKHLESHGISCEAIRIDEKDNKRFTFFRDPDQLPLELHE